MDRNHIDEIISSMLEKQLIYDKPSKKGTSYYIMEQMNNDIGNNTNNTNDYQIPNIDNSQELSVNTSDKDENLQSNFLVNLPLMKILLHLQVFRTKGVIITNRKIIQLPYLKNKYDCNEKLYDEGSL